MEWKAPEHETNIGDENKWEKEEEDSEKGQESIK